VKYAWIAKNKAAWPITMTCETLGVSASGYFEHQCVFQPNADGISG
jgi:putative transposase